MDDGFCQNCSYEVCQRCNVCSMCGGGLEGVDTLGMAAESRDLREALANAAKAYKGCTGCGHNPLHKCKSSCRVGALLGRDYQAQWAAEEQRSETPRDGE